MATERWSRMIPSGEADIQVWFRREVREAGVDGWVLAGCAFERHRDGTYHGALEFEREATAESVEHSPTAPVCLGCGRALYAEGMSCAWCPDLPASNGASSAEPSPAVVSPISATVGGRAMRCIACDEFNTKDGRCRTFGCAESDSHKAHEQAAQERGE